MPADKKEFFRCPECSNVFGSEETLREHFNLEHPEKEFKGVKHREKSLDRLKSSIPNLDRSFAFGLILGVLLGGLIFTGYSYWSSMDSSEVSITVVTCENCSYNRFTTATDRIFDASYREVDYQSEKGQQIMQKYDIRYVPGFVFSKNVEDAANYTGVAHQLVAFEDAYVLSDTGDEVAQRFSSGFSLNQSR